jgi:hypothetical protein
MHTFGNAMKRFLVQPAVYEGSGRSGWRGLGIELAERVTRAKSQIGLAESPWPL